MGRGAHRVATSLSGRRLLLCPRQIVSGLEQRLQRLRLRADQLIDRPGSD
jgi:hypothetical protein